MKREKMKVALVLVLFVLVVAASLVLPALGLKWQDRRIGNQVQFETTDEVVLRREDISSLDEKIRLFSGDNPNTRIAQINRNDSEEDELERVMEQALYDECQELYRLGILPDSFGGDLSLFYVEYWEEVRYFVFDNNNPSKSMVIWTYLIAHDDPGRCVVVNLEQESRKILGFSYWNFDYKADPYYDTVITEDVIREFAGYLGYETQSVSMEDYTRPAESYGGYAEEGLLSWESSITAATYDYGADIWGNPWREVYHVLIGAEEDGESDFSMEYLIKVGEIGVVFGEGTVFF